MSENVQININAKDNASPQLKKIGTNLKEMGANISQVGMRMTAAFTLPIVAMGSLILRSKEVQAILQPVKNEFAKIGSELGTAFVPLVKQAIPMLLQLAGTVRGVITWFSKLDPTTQKIIVGFAGFIAAVGPVIVFVGQLMTSVGGLVSVLGSLSAALPAVVAALGPLLAAAAPILALAAAIAFLAKVISDNWSTIQKGIAIIAYGATGKLPSWAWNIKESKGPLTMRANGGPVMPGQSYLVGERGPEIFRPSTSGNILPTGSTSGHTTLVNFTYSPVIGIGSEDEMYKAAFRLDQALRRRR